ncbi:ureidoglycolate lyase [Methylopila turkensis]|uniref:Ureidoglycolate lyase n=1 Tax=Methylopila turkensis TaxID=1437816 RepID=A0A9W6JQ61_9HYPH|nr:ureidoglycolate lyase [Methylopila turkensis]GLK80541.1 ureidoglycolate lyase [Methylopila turkensis]
MTRPLRPRALTAAAFAPFGAPIAIGSGPSRPVNGGRATRHDDIVAFDRAEDAPEARLALYRIAPSPRPFAIDVLERHPRSSQSFTPIVARDYLVVVAPSGPDGAPLVAEAQAFVAPAATGVHYARGVWHLPLVAFDAEALFAMWMWEAGDGGDTEEVRLAEPLFVEGF